jgi:hypothetical protein
VSGKVSHAAVTGRIKDRLPVVKAYSSADHSAVLDVIHFQMSSQFPQIFRRWLERINVAGVSNHNAGKKGIKTHIGANVVNHISDLHLLLHGPLLMILVAPEPAAMRA